MMRMISAYPLTAAFVMLIIAGAIVIGMVHG